MSSYKKVVGIMSGTSLDGVDFVLTKINSNKMMYLDQGHAAYPKAMREKLFKLVENKLDYRESQRLHFNLGQFYYKALKKIKDKKNWSFQIIGLHGQTVFHEAPHATSQIGEPSFLKAFGCPVVSDFRSKIVAEGGEGAPLAPLLHFKLMSGQKNWAFLNLGGMSNITLMSGAKKIATDLGPANVFIDWAAQKFLNRNYDHNGKMCLSGLPKISIVQDYMKQESFFSKRIPKSCGREEFSEEAFLSLMKKMDKLSQADKFASLAEISLQPVFRFLSKYKIKKLVVSGGGSKNKYFVKRLKIELQNIEVQTSEESLGFPIEAVEGAAFALLAYNKVHTIKSDLSYMKLNKKLSPLGRVD